MVTSMTTVCGFLKENGNGFRCFDEPTTPATKEQAIERYASEYPAETICEPLKHNSPFQCTRTVEAPMVTRLSLSPLCPGGVCNRRHHICDNLTEDEGENEQLHAEGRGKREGVARPHQTVPQAHRWTGCLFPPYKERVFQLF